MAGVTNCTAPVQLGRKRLSHCPLLSDLYFEMTSDLYCIAGGTPEWIGGEHDTALADDCPLVRITVRVGTPPRDVDWHPEVDLA